MTHDIAQSFAIQIAVKYGVAYLYDAANGEWHASALMPLAKWKHVRAIYRDGHEVVEYQG